MNGLPKHSRLCGQLRIQQLYRDGQRFVAWPLRVTFMPADDDTQVLVWAPKSLFKHAVDRNHLRRLMREAYRLHQDLLGDKHYLLAFNYIDKELQPFSVVEKAVCKALKKIAEK
ncbi:MAG: ribonuclease P protein component [Paludibacteraceae bacterium]|nr:ribonuclease P protein component [Paludibacteraceae bacterium]